LTPPEGAAYIAKAFTSGPPPYAARGWDIGEASRVDGRDRHTSRLRSDSAVEQSIALVITPLLFGLLGAFIDSRLGTRPAFMLALVTLGAVGAFLSAYYRYRERMAHDDQGKPWTYRSR